MIGPNEAMALFNLQLLALYRHIPKKGIKDIRVSAEEYMIIFDTLTECYDTLFMELSRKEMFSDDAN